MKMMKLLRAIGWLAAVMCSDSAMPNQELTRPFTLDEAKPLLVSLSKLSHVTVVRASPYSGIGSPYICWLSDPKLDSLSGVVVASRVRLQLRPLPFAGVTQLHR
jgi:hypothetical protein